MFFSSLHAEVSVIKDLQGNYSCILFAYRDNPENEVWNRYSCFNNWLALNENGDLSSDGIPSFGINPITYLPEIVWSKFDGSDYEIAYSYFNGIAWSNIELLTDNNIDDLNPNITFNNNGKAKVTWWSDEIIPQVYYKIKEYNAPWSSSLCISNASEISRFPSIAPLENLSYAGFEKYVTQASKIILVAGIIDDPDPHSPGVTYLGDSVFEPSTEPTSYFENGHLWVDWIYDENYLCWSEKIGDSWTAQQYEPYSGPDDIPRARLYIKTQVLNGQ